MRGRKTRYERGRDMKRVAGEQREYHNSGVGELLYHSIYSEIERERVDAGELLYHNINSKRESKGRRSRGIHNNK